MSNFESSTQEMAATNRRQKEYYEVADGATASESNGLATNLWRIGRSMFFGALRESNIPSAIESQHEEWFGDVAGLKVLDIGVGDGNPLSLSLAQDAGEYIAIDLSEKRTERYQAKLDAAGCANARAVAVDFLSEEFDQGDFDVVYAAAVVHHFAHLDAFLEVLASKLAPGGVVITHDPLDIWLPSKLVRRAYRPFQNDAEWEWPFNRECLDQIAARFDVVDVQGIYGRSKWAGLVGLVSKSRGRDAANRWHEVDVAQVRSLEDCGSCLQVTMKLRRR